MIDVSKYINSKDFQYAKGIEITTMDRELEEKINSTKDALDTINIKIARR